ncbi:MAG: hypothetical protein AABM67_21895 [Acidobacteriota bacterium]
MKIVFLHLAILLAASGAIAADRTGTLDISVRDLTGKPIGEATVYAIYSGRMGGRIPRFKADRDGRVVLRDLTPGSYEIHGFKDSEGYPDTFFSFFATNNKKAWQVVQVNAGSARKVVLELGPKYARLKLIVKNEQANLVGGTVIFTRLDDQNPYQQGIGGDTSVLVPPVAFRFKIIASGYEVWQSKVLRPRSGETLEVTVRLAKSH